jgi:hypothetical protein
MILYIYINAIDITTSVVAHESMITILKFQLLNTLSLSLSLTPPCIYYQIICNQRLLVSVCVCFLLVINISSLCYNGLHSPTTLAS